MTRPESLFWTFFGCWMLVDVLFMLSVGRLEQQFPWLRSMGPAFVVIGIPVISLGLTWVVARIFRK